MKTENVERYLNSFGKQVVNRAKGNLQKSKGGGTKLESSIKFKIQKDTSGYTVQFFMNSYGTFVETGRFISNLSLAFIMGRAIKRDGIQGISFFQKPLGLGIKQFGSDILKAIKIDVEKELKNNI